MQSQLRVTYRGTQIDLPLVKGITVGWVKESLLQHFDESLGLTADEVRLMLKGKILKHDHEDLYETLIGTTSKKKAQAVYRLMAVGVSQKESEQAEHNLRHGLEASAPRIRDDLTDKGKQDAERRKRLGRQMLQKAAGQRQGTATSADSYGFGSIETLPNLPRRDEAQRILETLANDPGVLACMAKHKWRVGSLAELYPEGNVGESEVCVMGLNQNRGMRILLRIRTDDLQGFRKMLSIRKVLFHELAHNVHSEHNGEFFQLMRQIEADCNAMDWTQGAGLTTTTMSHESFQGGTFRLGGDNSDGGSLPLERGVLSQRELVARAALRRQTVDEQDHTSMENSCECTRKDLFLPPKREDPMEE